MMLVVAAVAAIAVNQSFEESDQILNTHFGEWENKLTSGICSIFACFRSPFKNLSGLLLLSCSQIITCVLDFSHPTVFLTFF